jgi:hypothetical protein
VLGIAVTHIFELPDKAGGERRPLAIPLLTAARERVPARRRMAPRGPRRAEPIPDF